MIGLGGLGTTVNDVNGTNLGNLSDGIFLLNPGDSSPWAASPSRPES